MPGEALAPCSVTHPKAIAKEERGTPFLLPSGERWGCGGLPPHIRGAGGYAPCWGARGGKAPPTLQGHFELPETSPKGYIRAKKK